MKIEDMNAQMTRLYKAAKELKDINGQSELSRAMNASPQTINNWEARGISKAGLLDAEKIFGCSAIWLQTGSGEMQSNEGSLRANNLPQLHPDIQAVIKMMEETDDGGRSRVLNAVTDLLAQYKYTKALPGAILNVVAKPQLEDFLSDEERKIITEFREANPLGRSSILIAADTAHKKPHKYKKAS